MPAQLWLAWDPSTDRVVSRLYSAIAPYKAAVIGGGINGYRMIAL